MHFPFYHLTQPTGLLLRCLSLYTLKVYGYETSNISLLLLFTFLAPIVPEEAKGRREGRVCYSKKSET